MILQPDITQDFDRDDLTNFYTRRAFMHYAAETLAKNPEKEYLLMISDIVDFKHIIEIYGDREADELIKANARLISSKMPEGAVCARYSMDQFVCLVPRHEYYAEIQRESSAPITVTTENGARASVKVGACECTDHSAPVKLYIEHAFAALQNIKHKYGRFFAIVDDDLLERLHRNALIEEAMESALREEQFLVYYQPKHDTLTGKLVGAEALLRWLHPKLGFLSPVEFIPIFEQTGFITEADAYVWRKTCQNIRRWMDAALPVVPVSLNSSRTELTRDNYYYERRTEIAKEYNVPAELLHIEVTESMFGDHMDDIRTILERCHTYGLNVELDDFGTGYSSMHTLADFPLDVVKLDRSFVQQIDNPKKERVMVNCINMIKNMNLKIVAEGVETQHQLNRLKELDVDMIQGYFYSKPLPETAFEEYLRNTPILSLEEVNRRDAIKKISTNPMMNWNDRQHLISHVLGGILNMWDSVFVIDIRTGKSEDICGDLYFRENITESAMSEEIMRVYIEKSLVPKYRESYLEFYDFSTLEERFKKSNILYFEFEDYHSGWMRSTVLPAGNDADGHLSHILLAVTHINKEKMQQKKQDDSK